MKKAILTVLILSLLITMFSGCQAGNNNETVATVGTETISVGELKYYIEAVKAETIQNQTAEQQEVFWATEKDGKKPEETIRDKALELLVSSAVTAAKAKESNLTVTSTEVDKYFKDKYDEKTLADVIAKYKTNESTIKTIIRKQMLTSKYNDRIVKNDPRLVPTDAGLQKVFKDKFIKAQHILKLTAGQDEAKTPLPQDQKEQKKKEIDALLIQAKLGANFDALMAANSEDPGSKSQPQGYVFTVGEMVTEFYDAALNLKENEISDVVESSFGYHIIKRVPIDLKADFEASKEKVSKAFQQVAYEEIIAQLKSTLTITMQDDKIKSIPVK